MNDCCYKNIDKAVRKGRCHYECSVCSKDVSMLWAIYQEMKYLEKYSRKEWDKECVKILEDNKLTQ